MRNFEVDIQARRTLQSGHEGPANHAGIECEYGISCDGRDIDFRKIISDVSRYSPIPLVRESRYRYRLPSGHKFSCDGWYAELATPPEPLSWNGPAELTKSVMAAQEWMLGTLRAYAKGTGREIAVEGYSLHLNIQSPLCADPDLLARRFALEFGPLLIIIMNRRDSRGILSRPRPGRLEIAGEYIGDPERLRATIALCVGGFLATVDPMLMDRPRRSLKEEAIVPTHIRYGWRLTPEAVSSDLRRLPRRAKLDLADGSSCEMQDMIESCWDRIRKALSAGFSPEDISLAQQFITGEKLGSLERSDETITLPLNGRDVPAFQTPGSVRFANALSCKAIGEFEATVAFAHWDFVVYRLNTARHPILLSVPRRFLDGVARGHLNHAIQKALESVRHDTSAVAPILESAGQGSGLGLFSGIDTRALERDLEQASTTAKTKKPPKKKKKPPRSDQPMCVVVKGEDGLIQMYVPETGDPQRAVKEQEPPHNDVVAGHGVWLHSGAFGHSHRDHSVRSKGFPFEFRRNYRSSIDYDGVLGLGWDHSYNIRVVPSPPPEYEPIKGGWIESFDPTAPGGAVTFHDGTGRVTSHGFASWEIRKVRWCDARFSAVVTTYAQNPGEDFEIQRYAVVEGSPPDGLTEPIFYRIRYRDGTRKLLNCHGYVVQIRDRNHSTFRFDYGLPFNPSTGYYVLRSISDSQNRQYGLEYQVIGNVPRIVSLTDFGGRSLTFDYGPSVELTKVALVAPDRAKPARPEIHYIYGASRAGLLTGILNPEEASKGGEPFVHNDYDSQERVVSQKLGGTFGFAYVAPGMVTVTDRTGVAWDYELSGGVAKRVSVEDEVYVAAGKASKARLAIERQHDENFHLKLITYPSGRQERFGYRNFNAVIADGNELDSTENEIFAHKNDLGRDALLEHEIIPNDASPSVVTRYEYEYLFNSITQVDAPLGTTRYEYLSASCSTPEMNGNPIEVTYPPQLDPDGNLLDVIEEISYGVGGARSWFSDADGIEHDWDLNESGLALSHEVGGELQEILGYDDFGNIIRREDGRGAVWTTKYDLRDRLVELTDPMGHVERFSYDLNDRLTQKSVRVVDDPNPIQGYVPDLPAEYFETMNYDILGNRLEHTQKLDWVNGSDSRTWRTEYDGEGRVAALYTPRATSGEKPDAIERYTYTARGHAKTVTTAFGGPAAGTTRHFYDEDGKHAGSQGPEGHLTVIAYDGYGRIQSETLPNGTVLHREYDGPRLVHQWVTGNVDPAPIPLGGRPSQRVLRETFFEIDASHRVVKAREQIFLPEARGDITVPASDEAVTRTWYTPAGRKQKVVERTGATTVIGYGNQGQIETMTLPGGHTSVVEYDGDLISKVTTNLSASPAVNASVAQADVVLTETREHDSLGRLTRREDAQGLSSQYGYDSMGHLKVEQSLQGTKEYRLDRFFRLQAVSVTGVDSPSNPHGRMTVRYEYDLNDNRTRMIDGLFGVTSFEYDARDLPIASESPGAGSATITRRRDGKVETITSGNGLFTYSYSSTGMIKTVEVTGGGAGHTQIFGYDGADELSWCADSNGSADPWAVVTFFERDSLARIVSERTKISAMGFDQSVGVDYAPDQLGKTLRYPTPFGSNPAPSLMYSYGTDGLLARVERDSQLWLERSYLGPGRPTATSMPMSLKNGRPAGSHTVLLNSIWEYDDTARPFRRTFETFDLTTQKAKPLSKMSPEQLSFGPTSGMIEQGIRTSNDLKGTEKSLYGYDGAGRLSEYSSDDGKETEDLRYDWDAGNRLRQVLAKDKKTGAYVPSKLIDYQSDGSRIDQTGDPTGGLSETVWRFDSQGRLSGDVTRLRFSAANLTRSSRSLDYDVFDRLTKSDRTSSVGAGAASSRRFRYTYLYDAMGRLVARMGGEPFRTDETQFFLNCGGRCLAEFDAKQTPERLYFYDDRGQLIGYQQADTAASAWIEVLPILTQQGEPWILMGRASPSADPQFIGGMDLYPFKIYDVLQPGAPVAPPPGKHGVVLPVTADGRRFFAEEGLFYNSKRFYDPLLGSFITVDPLGVWADPKGAGNPRVFSGNNPVGFGDDGNIGHVAWGAIMGGVGGAAFYLIKHDRHQWTWGGFFGATAAGAIGGAVFAATFGYVAVALGATSVSGAGLATSSNLLAVAVAGAADGLVSGAFSGGLSGYLEGNGVLQGMIVGGATGLILGAAIPTIFIGAGGLALNLVGAMAIEIGALTAYGVRYVPRATQVLVSSPTIEPILEGAAQQIVRTAARLRALKQVMPDVSAGAEAFAFVGNKTGKVYAASACRNTWREALGVGQVLEQIEKNGYKLIGGIKYRGNQGLDFIFEGIGPNHGRLAVGEAKFSGALDALTEYKGGLRQGSRAWFVDRLIRAGRRDLVIDILMGRVDFFAGFASSRQLFKIDPNLFVRTSADMQIPGAMQLLNWL